MIKSNSAELLRVMKFAVIGVIATLVHLVIAQLLLALDWSPFASNFGGFVVAFGAGFLGHHFVTFQGHAPFWKAMRRYGLIACTGFLANNVLLIALVSSGWLSEAVSLAIAILVIPAGTFLASRFWGFATQGS